VKNGAILEKRVVRRQSIDHIDDQGLHPVLARVLNHRSCGYTAYQLKDLAEPTLLSNIDSVVDRLIEHLQKQSKILIVGDYDCDGATATAVAVRGLRMLGYASVDYLIPNRFKSGYGLSEMIIDQALAQSSSLDLLITVDNGISSISGVSYALKRGIDVIITDHHLPGDQLPATDMIVNPQLPGDTFPSKAICGVGVIYYVLLALRRKLVDQGRFNRENQPNFMSLIDLVTLGTIADCVPFDQNNRILVAHGLRRFRQGLICHGLRAMLDVIKMDLASITTVDIAFKLAPKLNAAGRMDDMSIGVQCLLSDDYESARSLAHMLVSFNEQRRDIQSSIQVEALKQVSSSRDPSKNIRANVLYHSDWHEGVIGIIASRIKDLTHRPTIVFTDENESLLKGSGRSIKGIHLRDALADIHAAHDILPKFGGHAMAAGLTIKKTDLSCFTDAFHQRIAAYADECFTEVIYTDGPLDAGELNLATAQAIREYGIWGQNYPEPVFDNVFAVKRVRLLKGKHLKLDLMLDYQPVAAMWFFIPDACIPLITVGVQLRAFYKLDVNTYLGESSLSLIIEHGSAMVEAVASSA